MHKNLFCLEKRFLESNDNILIKVETFKTMKLRYVDLINGYCLCVCHS